MERDCLHAAREHGVLVIASVRFRNFKALRDARVRLAPFNLVLGPNGSGKTSLIEALLHLRGLANLAPRPIGPVPESGGGPDIQFQFTPPHAAVEVRLGCVDATRCNALNIRPPDAPDWPALKAEIARIRSYVFDHEAMSRPAPAEEADELSADAANLPALLATWKRRHPEAYAAFVREALRLFPEYSAMALRERPGNRIALAFTLVGEVGVVDVENISQGTLHTLGILALSVTPTPPSVLCIEEIDRGVHPRMLREIRDAFYRLSYPEASGLKRPPVQVLATTHSPYLLDLFRDHPEEIVLTQKHGREAHFMALTDLPNFREVLVEGALGDLWFSGILGGVPEVD